MPSHDDAPIAVQARKAGTAAEIDVYGDIGFWGITAASFKDALRGLGDVKSLVVNVNSPGGDVFEAIAIFNLIRNHPAIVTTHNDALAASAASFVMLAGDRVVSAPHSQWMIHEAWGIAVGNAGDMRKAADFLERQTEVIAGIYAERGQTPEHWLELMREETWFTAEEAVAAGLADEVAGEREHLLDALLGQDGPARRDVAQHRNLHRPGHVHVRVVRRGGFRRPGLGRGGVRAAVGR